MDPENLHVTTPFGQASAPIFRTSQAAASWERQPHGGPHQPFAEGQNADDRLVQLEPQLLHRRFRIIIIARLFCSEFKQIGCGTRRVPRAHNKLREAWRSSNPWHTLPRRWLLWQPYSPRQRWHLVLRRVWDLGAPSHSHFAAASGLWGRGHRSGTLKSRNCER